MLAATVVGTLLIPVMYYVVQSIRERVKGQPKPTEKVAPQEG
jgi:hypothetical protein